MAKEASTLRDVAKLAGVSAGTVSKYLNNPESVKERNRISIAESIETLHYTPNTLAQRLATGKSNVILLYILLESNISTSTWLHQLPLIQTLNGYLEQTSYVLQIQMGSIQAFDEANQYIRHSIDSRNIDGVILMSSWAFPKANILTLLQKDFPFVLIDNRNPLLNGEEVSCDNKEIVTNLVEYLVARNHKRIAFLNVETSQQHMCDRYAGYVEAVKQYNLDTDPDLLQYGDFSIGSGFHCMERLLKLEELPTAILAGNDNMAVGAIKAIRNAGLRVPEDISVVGIDNSIVAQASDPVLTTVEMPLQEMGITAIEGLLKKIEDPDYEITKRILSARIVEGASVGTAKKIGGEPALS